MLYLYLIIVVKFYFRQSNNITRYVNRTFANRRSTLASNILVLYIIYAFLFWFLLNIRKEIVAGCKKKNFFIDTSIVTALYKKGQKSVKVVMCRKFNFNNIICLERNNCCWRMAQPFNGSTGWNNSYRSNAWIGAFNDSKRYVCIKESFHSISGNV